MFFLKKKKDGHFELAQNLLAVLADSASEKLKEQINHQSSLMKKVKRCNFDSALALFFKNLPENARIENPSMQEVPFASIHLMENEKDIFADFSIGPDGLIRAVQFTSYPKTLRLNSFCVSFYPNILKMGVFIPKQNAPFYISEKLVTILGEEWKQTFVQHKKQKKDNIFDSEYENESTFNPAYSEELRQEWGQLIHTELPSDWHEFSKYFYSLIYHNATIYGCCEEIQLIPMHPGETAMYLIDRIPNDRSSTGESYVLASAEKKKQNTLYYLDKEDGSESDCIPIGNDLFGFIKEAHNQDYLKSL